MSTSARAEELLEQIRALPPEDREYIESALVNESHDSIESPDVMEEIVRRANAAIAGTSPSYGLEEAMSRVETKLHAARSQKP